MSRIWAAPGGLAAVSPARRGGHRRCHGLAARTEERDVDVLLLKPSEPGCPQLTPTASTGGSMCSTKQEQDRVVATFINQTASGLAGMLESHVSKPVIDETGLTKGYDFESCCRRNPKMPRRLSGHSVCNWSQDAAD